MLWRTSQERPSRDKHCVTALTFVGLTCPMGGTPSGTDVRCLGNKHHGISGGHDAIRSRSELRDPSTRFSLVVASIRSSWRLHAPAEQTWRAPAMAARRHIESARYRSRRVRMLRFELE